MTSRGPIFLVGTLSGSSSWTTLPSPFSVAAPGTRSATSAAEILPVPRRV